MIVTDLQVKCATLQIIQYKCVTILLRHTEIPIYSKVTQSNCKYVTLQITHLKLLQSCVGTINAFMPMQDRNKNTCRFGNVILGQVTLSWLGSDRLDWSCIRAHFVWKRIFVSNILTIKISNILLLSNYLTSSLIDLNIS